MRSYYLFGFFSNDLSGTAIALAQVFAVQFELHESSYRGGDYYRFGGHGQEEFILQRNHDSLDNEPFEASIPEQAILLHVGSTVRGDEIQQFIDGAFGEAATMIRHELL